MTDYLNQVHFENCLTGLPKLPAKCISMCVTSPPYYQLRNYEVSDTYWPPCKYALLGFEKDIPEWTGQLGLEPNPEMYIAHMVLVFNEVYRVMDDKGTLWVNIGDSHVASNMRPHGGERKNRDQGGMMNMRRESVKGLTKKDLIGIPWRLAFALQQSGWVLRQDIIWNKPNPMPESVRDRCTKSHEYILFFSKTQKYYFNSEAIKTPIKDSTVQRMRQQIDKQNGSCRVPGKTNGDMKAVGPGRTVRKGVDTRGGNQGSEVGIPAMGIHSGNFDSDGSLIGDGMANKKSVWTITTQKFKEAHFATFPDKLPETCIKAGCPVDGVVLDPFSGSGKTAIVARMLNRNYVAYDMKPEYIQLSAKEKRRRLGMFEHVTQTL